MDNKNSSLNLLEEMKQYLSAAGQLRKKMDEKVRTLCGQEPPRGEARGDADGEDR